jgi:hypothetical protein
MSGLSGEARIILRRILQEQYEDYKERLVGSNDEQLRGRAQELKRLIAEIDAAQA